MSDAPLTPQQLKAARELLGWSQMDVANRGRLTEWVVGFFERGEHLIRARYLRRMRSIFETAGRAFPCGSFVVHFGLRRPGQGRTSIPPPLVRLDCRSRLVL